MSGPPPENRDVTFERKDVNERSAFWFGVWILVIMVAVALLVKPLYNLLAREEAGSQPPSAYLPGAEPRTLEPPGPRLQVRPGDDLAAFRSQEDRILAGYAWVDKEKGIVRIPVEEAMRLVAERGLPVFPKAPEEKAAR
jgi:hypothetical protein